MFLLFDGTPLQTDFRHRGVGRYSANLLQAMARVRSAWRIEMIQHGNLPKLDDHLLVQFPIRDFYQDSKRNFAEWITAQQPDWVCYPHMFDHEMMVSESLEVAPRTVAILYDLIPLLFPTIYLNTHDSLGRYADRFRAISRMNLLLAISESTREDGYRFLGAAAPQIVNIRGAADESLRPERVENQNLNEDSIRTKFNLTKPYILYVGGADFRKNLVGSIHGFAAIHRELREPYHYVVCCSIPAPELARLQEVAKAVGVDHLIRFTGYVSDAELVALYRSCRLFFFPSKYEGLGLPLLEAMQCGAPVVTSNRSAMPEFGGPHSWYCDPDSVESMASTLMQALAEPRDLRRADREAFAANFTWDAVAEAAAVALESFVPRVAVAKPKPRIAWVSPTPPSRTGIADYAVEVARTLSDRFELEWIIDADAEQPSLEVSKTWLCLSRSDFANRHRARPYDLFVYHLGNSRFHAYQLPMLQDYPGLAVLHDLSCGYIGDPSQDHSVWPGSLLDEVRFHGDEFIAMLVESNLMKASIAPRFSRMSRRILQSIVAGIVHSNTAWQETRRLTDAPISVVPMIAVAPLLRTRQEERKRLGIPADRWVVTTLGLDDHAKRTPTIVKAIANLPDDLKQRTLFIVAGEMGQQKKRELEQLARERGIPGQVECRGRVELDDLAAYAFAAEVNIQLRYPSNGETSAVLLRALAAGATCITSDSATMAEFPNSVTLKVRSPAQDEVDLTAALTRLASDESLRVELGQNARRFIAERHSPQIVAAHYAAAVEQAMQQLRLRPTLLR